MKNVLQVFTVAILVVCPNILAAQTIRSMVYAGDALPPYISGVMGEQMAGGIGFNIVSRILRELDLPMVTLVTPFSRIPGMVERGQVDIVFPALRNPVSKTYFLFSKPLYETRAVILFALDRSTPIDLGMQGNVSGLTVGLLKGYEPSEAFEAHVRKYSTAMIKVDSIASMFRLIRLGRIDFTVLDEFAAKHTLASNANWARWIQMSDDAVYDLRISIGVAKQSPLVTKLSQVNRAIEQLTISGELQQILMQR